MFFESDSCIILYLTSGVGLKWPNSVPMRALHGDELQPTGDSYPRDSWVVLPSGLDGKSQKPMDLHGSLPIFTWTFQVADHLIRSGRSKFDLEHRGRDDALVAFPQLLHNSSHSWHFYFHSMPSSLDSTKRQFFKPGRFDVNFTVNVEEGWQNLANQAQHDQTIPNNMAEDAIAGSGAACQKRCTRAKRDKLRPLAHVFSTATESNLNRETTFIKMSWKWWSINFELIPIFEYLSKIPTEKKCARNGLLQGAGDCQASVHHHSQGSGGIPTGSLQHLNPKAEEIFWRHIHFLYADDLLMLQKTTNIHLQIAHYTMTARVSWAHVCMLVCRPRWAAIVASQLHLMDVHGHKMTQDSSKLLGSCRCNTANAVALATELRRSTDFVPAWSFMDFSLTRMPCETPSFGPAVALDPPGQLFNVSNYGMPSISGPGRKYIILWSLVSQQMLDFGILFMRHRAWPSNNLLMAPLTMKLSSKRQQAVGSVVLIRILCGFCMFLLGKTWSSCVHQFLAQASLSCHIS